mmetsp:Transcript_24674/g.80513  ORF Transcript_24674/g.80513 Transcript_24674/m.80513 type:complete len:223 (-) Transcript_24674:582-1250(-)
MYRFRIVVAGCGLPSRAARRLLPRHVELGGELHGLHILLALQRRQRVVLGADRDVAGGTGLVVLIVRDPKRLDEARVGYRSRRHPLRLRTALPGGLDEVLLVPSGHHPLREHARLPRNRTDGAAQAGLLAVNARWAGGRAGGRHRGPTSPRARVAPRHRHDLGPAWPEVQHRVGGVDFELGVCARESVEGVGRARLDGGSTRGARQGLALSAELQFHAAMLV